MEFALNLVLRFKMKHRMYETSYVQIEVYYICSNKRHQRFYVFSFSLCIVLHIYICFTYLHLHAIALIMNINKKSRSFFQQTIIYMNTSPTLGWSNRFQEAYNLLLVSSY